MKTVTKRPGIKSLTAAAVVAAIGSVAAQAAPISSWSFSTNATFTSATFEGKPFFVPPFSFPDRGTTSTSANELSWGATGGDFTVSTSNRSALTIGKNDGTDPNNDLRTGGGPATGFVNTTFGGAPDPLAGEVGQGVSITHWNNPISSSFNTLLSGTVLDTLTLTPLTPADSIGAATVDAPEITFEFKFSETPNNPASGVCEDGGPIPANGCEDLFGFEAVTLNQSFTYFDIADGIDRTYFASVFILGPGGSASPIATLTNGECSALGLNNGCFGFRTIEAAQTTAQFAFAITTDRITNSVPAPGTLALMALALGGLGATARYRKSR